MTLLAHLSPLAPSAASHRTALLRSASASAPPAARACGCSAGASRRGRGPRGPRGRRSVRGRGQASGQRDEEAQVEAPGVCRGAKISPNEAS